MGLYNERDISLNFSGDIEIGANGDLKLADSYESQKSAINWFMRTNRGDYVPDRRLGCDAGRFVGKPLESSTVSDLKDSVLSNLVKFVISRGDINVDVVPIDYETLGIFVAVGGNYLDSDGNLLDAETEIITYVFPYLEGFPTPVL